MSTSVRLRPGANRPLPLQLWWFDLRPNLVTRQPTTKDAPRDRSEEIVPPNDKIQGSYYRARILGPVYYLINTFDLPSCGGLTGAVI
jgi:hypothetical protein